MKKICILFGLTLSVSLAQSGATVMSIGRTVFAGDSITEANSAREGTAEGGATSWRYDFWKMMVDNNVQGTFVGDRTSNHNGPSTYDPYMGLTFTNAHEATWGTTSAFLRNSLNGRYEDLAADTVYLFVGSNDVFSTSSTAAITAAMERQRTIVNGFQGANPDASIFVIGVMSRKYSATNEDARNPVYQDLNTELGLMAVEETTATSTVTLINFHADVSYEWLYDGIHPNTTGPGGVSGQAEIAQRIYDASVPLAATAIPEPSTLLLSFLTLPLCLRRKR
jgi:lysophospholipase L1-like esterase